MSETNWTMAQTEPDVRGKVTKKERPVPVASSDDPLKAGTAMLAEAAKAASADHRRPRSFRITSCEASPERHDRGARA